MAYLNLCAVMVLNISQQKLFMCRLNVCNLSEQKVKYPKSHDDIYQYDVNIVGCK